MMQYTSLGKTGIEVSRLCLGCMSFGNSQEWHLEIDEARPVFKKAIDLGFNFFDTANIYSRGRSEEITGSLLKEYRDEVVIATKVFFKMGEKLGDQGLSRYAIRKQVERSLERLQTDRIDLYQIHRLDPLVPFDALLRTLNQLIDEGKVLHIGASSMFAWQFTKSLWIADRLGLEPFRTMQNHYSLIYREEEREMLPLCNDQEIGVIPWSPLGRGFLTGKYKRGEEPESIRYRSDGYMKARHFRPEDFDVVERVTEIAKEKGVSNVQIALAWLMLKDPVVAPIIGTHKVEHLEEVVGSFDVKLDKNDIQRLEEPYKPHSVLGHGYSKPT